MSLGKPESYRIQHGCTSCAHVFVREEYDEEDTYYCTYDAPPRPRSGGSSNAERFRWHDKRTNGDVGEIDLARWFEWSDNREVYPEGICDEFAPKDMRFNEVTPDSKAAIERVRAWLDGTGGLPPEDVQTLLKEYDHLSTLVEQFSDVIGFNPLAYPGGRRLPDPDLLQDPAFLAHMLATLEKDKEE